MIALRLTPSERSFLRNGSTLRSRYGIRLSPTLAHPKSMDNVLRRVCRVHNHCILRFIVDNQISIVIVAPGPFDMFSANSASCEQDY